MSLDPHMLKRFNAARRVRDPRTLCYAPELSLNFDQTGQVTSCCFNRSYVLGTYPNDSIEEIWTSKRLDRLRTALRRNDLSLGCQQCEKMIRAGNDEGVLISHFDDFAPLADDRSPIARLFGRGTDRETVDRPAVFEFEISNTCNMGCIMCGGKWSSVIRRDREKLPPLESPYDDDFVRQIEGFLPTLKRANFLGGEPFLIKPYLAIWESIARINPDIEVAVTSNGSIWNRRVERILNDLKRVKLTLSIDSLRKETYESIRLGGDFDTVRRNIDRFLDMGVLVSFSVCPMIQNWREMPEILAFAQDHDLDVYFNTVLGPLGQNPWEYASTGDGPAISLMLAEADHLQSIIDEWSHHRFEDRWQRPLDALIAQVSAWRNDAMTKANP